MERKRKYDRDFKIEAVRLATEGNRKITEVARNLGIHPNLIYNWKKQLAGDSRHSFPGHGRIKPDDEQFRKLKRELEDTKEERDILKKALAIFSKKPR
jgi:transposase